MLFDEFQNIAPKIVKEVRGTKTTASKGSGGE